VAAVRFAINGVTVATDVIAPYQFTYSVPVGISNLNIRATAIDSAGNSKDSDVVTIGVTSDPPPTLEILEPEEGAELIQGLNANLFANASDNVQVTKIDFFVNGVKIQNDFFNSTTFDVPLGISTLTIEARATDNLGQTGSATRTVNVAPYTGPTTTVTGRVFDGPDLPVPGLTVSVFNVFTTQTGPDGTFTLAGVPTVRGSITANVSGQFNGRTISRSFASQSPVEGGVTDLGDLILTRQHAQDLFQIPTTVASGFGITHVVDGEDFFFGFEDFNRLYWAGGFSNSQGGVFIPWTSTETLPPFTGVRSADVSLGHVYAQLKTQPGLVTDFSFAFNIHNFHWEPQSLSLETGLSVECDGIAANYDTTGQHLPVLAFLGTTSQGAELTVRTGNGGDGYNPPVVLPVEPDERLRTPKLHDINRDGLVDLLLIRQVSPNESHLVVYPRISATQFGPPVESPITVRSAPATASTVDYSIAEFDASHVTSVAILGDDRVRFYAGDANGAFSPSGELALPNGTIPLAVTATSYHRGEPLFADSLSSVVVSTAAAGSPESRAVHVFLNRGNGFEPARVFGYLVPADTGTDSTRVFVSSLNGFGTFEAVAVDGHYLTVLYEVIPLFGF
jgi:hypothetical protein